MLTEYAVSYTDEETVSSDRRLRSICLRFIAAAQNPDGGWGHHPGAQSSVEASAWALMALASRARQEDAPDFESLVAQRSLSNAAPAVPALSPAPNPPVGSDFWTPMESIGLRTSETPALQEEPQSLPRAQRGGQSTDPALQTADFRDEMARGLEWLSQVQLPDGSWPAFQGLREGCWVTAPACMALREHAPSAGRVARGIEWLVGTRPAEVTLWRRLQRRLSRGPSAARQNLSLYGWSWTPGTASWVEPTAYALILLAAVPEALHPAGTAKRISLAESMLYDRMCAGGGWNTGNPEVYGVAGVPRVGPTAWALIALRRHGARPENQRSLNWLENHYSGIRGPASLALAELCLASCGRRVRPRESALWKLYRENQFLRGVLVFAWAAIAISDFRWPIAD